MCSGGDLTTIYFADFIPWLIHLSQGRDMRSGGGRVAGSEEGDMLREVYGSYQEFLRPSEQATKSFGLSKNYIKRCFQARTSK